MATEMVRNLNRMASAHHRETADTLTGLRDRLGRDGLSVEEWNALLHAISDHRLDSDRRARSDFNEVNWPTPIRLFSLEGEMFPTLQEAHAEANRLIGRGSQPVTVTPVVCHILTPAALCLMLNSGPSDGLEWLTDEAETYDGDRPAP